MVVARIRGVKLGQDCPCCPGPCDCQVPGTAGQLIYATASGFADDIASHFPSAYSSILAAVPDPLHARVNGSHVTACMVGATFEPRVRALDISYPTLDKSQDYGVPPTNAELAPFKSAWDYETAGCGYADPWPGILSPRPATPGASLAYAIVREVLQLRLGCSQPYYGGDRVVVDAYYSLNINFQVRYASGRTVSVSRSVTKLSLVYRPTPTVAVVPFLLTADMSTSDLYNGGALENVSVSSYYSFTNTSCKDQSSISPNPVLPFGGTLTFSG